MYGQPTSDGEAMVDDDIRVEAVANTGVGDEYDEDELTENVAARISGGEDSDENAGAMVLMSPAAVLENTSCRKGMEDERVNDADDDEEEEESFDKDGREVGSEEKCDS